MMKTNSPEHKLTEIRSLKDKADMLASIHSRLSDRYGHLHTWLSSFLLLVSTLLVGLTFISEEFVRDSVGIFPSTLKWIVGIMSILNFAGIMLLAEWKFQDKAASHREAVRFYFVIVNRIRSIIDSGVDISDEMIDEIRTEYGRTQTLPKIPDARFLELKQWHLQKIAISRELSKNPFEKVSAIKNRLSQHEDKK